MPLWFSISALWAPFAPHPRQHMVLLISLKFYFILTKDFKILAFLRVGGVCSRALWNSLNTNVMEQIILCLLDIQVSPFAKCTFSFCPFFYWLTSVSYWFVEVFGYSEFKLFNIDINIIASGMQHHIPPHTQTPHELFSCKVGKCRPL